MKKKKGFTVIEVSLVLAIAGLIFIMVFIALPALRRSQRDTQRREDILSFLEEVKQYQKNNRGALPTNWTSFRDDYMGEFSDPYGGSYEIINLACSGRALGTPCAEASSDLGSIEDASFPNGYRLFVVTQATCSGNEAVATSNPRKIAAVYRLEGAGSYCANT